MTFAALSVPAGLLANVVGFVLLFQTGRLAWLGIGLMIVGVSALIGALLWTAANDLYR